MKGNWNVSTKSLSNSYSPLIRSRADERQLKLIEMIILDMPLIRSRADERQLKQFTWALKNFSNLGIRSRADERQLKRRASTAHNHAQPAWIRSRADERQLKHWRNSRFPELIENQKQSRWKATETDAIDAVKSFLSEIRSRADERQLKRCWAFPVYGTMFNQKQSRWKATETPLPAMPSRLSSNQKQSRWKATETATQASTSKKESSIRSRADERQLKLVEVVASSVFLFNQKQSRWKATET